MCYFCYHLALSTKLRAFLLPFFGYFFHAFASLYRLTESRYDKVYEASTTTETNTLDKLYTKFNIDHPADFKGHSLSMSDIIVLNDHAKRTSWYCDSFGFREVPGFSRAPQQTEKRGKAR